MILRVNIAACSRSFVAGSYEANKELGESRHACKSDRGWSRPGLHTSGVGRCRFVPGRGRSPLLDSLLSLDVAYHSVTTSSDTQQVLSPRAPSVCDQT